MIPTLVCTVQPIKLYTTAIKGGKLPDEADLSELFNCKLIKEGIRGNPILRHSPSSLQGALPHISFLDSTQVTYPCNVVPSWQMQDVSHERPVSLEMKESCSV